MKHLCIALSLLSSIAFAQSPSTSDAAALQQTFAKISFAHQLRTIHLAVMQERQNKQTTDLTAALQAERLDFTVNILAAGAVSELANTKMSDLLSDANGRRLVIGHVGFGTNGVEEDQADVKWSDGSYGNSGDLSKYTLRQALVEAKVDTTCQRYVRASITATYKGQSGQWNAMYLLGCASAKVVATDLVMGDAVEKFWDANVYPSSLLGLHIFADNEAVKTWLRNNASSTCPTKTACYENGRITVPQADVPTITGAVLTPNGNQCVDFGFIPKPWGPVTNIGYDDHTVGSHSWTAAYTFDCAYSGPPGQECFTEAVITPSSAVSEALNSKTGYVHVEDNTAQGGGEGKVGNAEVYGLVAGAIKYCIIGVCGGGMTVTGTRAIGFSLTWGASDNWKNSQPWHLVCPAKTAGRTTSPIVIDLENKGYHFVAPSVRFDPDGKAMVTMSWPDAEYGNGFLALPENGQITSGKQLFGNNTPQPPCEPVTYKCQNGFRALAVYDSNHDGVIDNKDPVWHQLRVWVDRNMNGRVDEGELLTLDEAGLKSISLAYRASTARVDWAYLEYESTVTGHPGDRVIYDAWLEVQ